MEEPKNQPNLEMNTTITLQDNQHRYRPQFGGNSVTESENPLARLYETYREAGLALSDAWDAALADYAQEFNAA